MYSQVWIFVALAILTIPYVLLITQQIRHQGIRETIASWTGGLFLAVIVVWGALQIIN